MRISGGRRSKLALALLKSAKGMTSAGAGYRSGEIFGE